jgi:hypothetical protein
VGGSGGVVVAAVIPGGILAHVGFPAQMSLNGALFEPLLTLGVYLLMLLLLLIEPWCKKSYSVFGVYHEKF